MPDQEVTTSLSDQLAPNFPDRDPATVGRVPAHWDFAIGVRGPNHYARNSGHFSRFRNFHIFTEFRDNPSPDWLEPQHGDEFSKPHCKMTGLAMLPFPDFPGMTARFRGIVRDFESIGHPAKKSRRGIFVWVG